MSKTTFLIFKVSVILAMGLVLLLAFIKTAGLRELAEKRELQAEQRIRCQQLAAAALTRVRGKSAEDLKALAGPEAVVEFEDGLLWVDDLAFRMEDGKVAELLVEEYCQ